LPFIEPVDDTEVPTKAIAFKLALAES